jgi:hypothetical protein
VPIYDGMSVSSDDTVPIYSSQGTVELEDTEVDSSPLQRHVRFNSSVAVCLFNRDDESTRVGEIKYFDRIK